MTLEKKQKKIGKKCQFILNGLFFIVSVLLLSIPPYLGGKNDAQNTKSFRTIESEKLAIVYENAEKYICIPYTPMNDSIELQKDQYVVIDKDLYIISTKGVLKNEHEN